MLRVSQPGFEKIYHTLPEKMQKQDWFSRVILELLNSMISRGIREDNKNLLLFTAAKSLLFKIALSVTSLITFSARHGLTVRELRIPDFIKSSAKYKVMLTTNLYCNNISILWKCVSGSYYVNNLSETVQVMGKKENSFVKNFPAIAKKYDSNL